MSYRAALAVPLFLFALVPACSSSKGAAAPPPPRECALDMPSAAPDWRIHADGLTLRDSANRVVMLRGVNAGARSKLSPFMPFDYDVSSPSDFTAKLNAYMDHATTWGINVLRVPFIWNGLEPTQGKDDEDYLKRYDALVDAAWARGMWTLVDFHQDLYAENLCGDGFPSWTLPDPKPAPHHDCPPTWGFHYFQDPAVMAAFDAFWAKGSPVQAAYVAMWDRVLARYKDHPGVLGFDVFNEPSHGSAQDASAWEASTLSDFYATLIPHLRADAPNALFFIEPDISTVLSQTSQLKRPPGDGLVFAPHFYPIGTAGMADGMKRWADLGAQWNVPTFVGEFARANYIDDAVTWVTTEWDAIDANAMSGGTQWEYSESPLIWNNELYSITRPDGTDFPVADALRRVYPRVIAGGAPTITIDVDDNGVPTKRTWSFAPTSSSGVTDFALPDGAYKNGFDIALSGACLDRSKANHLLVKADDGAASVTMSIAPHP